MHFTEAEIKTITEYRKANPTMPQRKVAFNLTNLRHDWYGVGSGTRTFRSYNSIYAKVRQLDKARKAEVTNTKHRRRRAAAAV